MTSAIQLPVTYRPRPRRLLAILSGALLFVIIGVALYQRNPLLMGGGAVFFGLVALVVIANMHPRASFLTLTEQGFEMASLFRRHFIAWKDVGEFVPVVIGGSSMVGWNYLPGYGRAMRARRIGLAISGIEAALPDTYGHSSIELARLMNELRARYGPR